MAQSTLAITWADLMNDVGFFLGYQRESNPAHPVRWTSDEADALNRYVKAGLRQFYIPPVLPDERVSHEWSFLNPRASLTVWVTATGTMAVGGTGNKTVTDSANSPFYPSMVGKTLVADTSENEYAIEAYVSASVVTVTTDASADDGDTFTITANGSYRLPDEFGAILGDLTFDPGEGLYPAIPITSEVRIRKLIQASDSTGRPVGAAVTPVSAAGSSHQVFDLVVYPIPDADYVLHYRQMILANAMTNSAGHPWGGAAHATTIRDSCLAAAAKADAPERAEETWDDFMRSLRASVNFDRRAMTPEHLGANTDPLMADLIGPGSMRRMHGSHLVYHNGVAYPT